DSPLLAREVAAETRRVAAHRGHLLARGQVARGGDGGLADGGPLVRVEAQGFVGLVLALGRIRRALTGRPAAHRDQDDQRQQRSRRLPCPLNHGATLPPAEDRPGAEVSADGSSTGNPKYGRLVRAP